MTRRAIHAWGVVHTWSSLVCTAFLMLLCLTGLPLIFHDEIDAALGHAPGAGLAGPASAGEDPGLLPLDVMLARALAARPGEVPLFMAFDGERPLLTITTGPRPDAPREAMTLQLFDRVSGAAVGRDDHSGPTAFLLDLHTDLFLGLPGELFLGAMGLLFVAALVSGAVLYAPFMRKLDFGTLRRDRRPRVHWLDQHNLIGIVALAWMAIVGISGVVNALATPIMKVWQANDLADMTRAYAGRAAPPPTRYASLDGALAAARRALPGYAPQFVAFPGGGFSSRYHYAVFFQGTTPATRRLLTPALVDAVSGRLTDVRPMPWYARALSLAQPLHFGDYGGLPLKLLWAALDVFTLVVLGSGLYLWVDRRLPRRAVPRRTAAA